uniref:Uncharacterized protein n=1 Tax=Cyprinus carpio TaxID=7962 RepID=A0A8C2E0Y1_CYPCA
MAATLPSILSFGKITKALLSGLRLSAVPAQQYSVECHGGADDSVSCLLLLQVYDEKDVRRARVIDRQKEVSLNYFNTAYGHCNKALNCDLCSLEPNTGNM